MKKLKTTTLLFLGLYSILNAQIDTTQNKKTTKPRHFISFYPFALIGSTMMLGYEYKLKKNLGIKLNVGVGYGERNFYQTTASINGNIYNFSNFYAETQLSYYH